MYTTAIPASVIVVDVGTVDCLRRPKIEPLVGIAPTEN